MYVFCFMYLSIYVVHSEADSTSLHWLVMRTGSLLIGIGTTTTTTTLPSFGQYRSYSFEGNMLRVLRILLRNWFLSFLSLRFLINT